MKPKTCPCCNSAYRPSSSRNGPSKLPLLLKCSHTFCESCLMQKIGKKKDKKIQQITCPTCKKQMSLPNGIRDLQTNSYLFAQIDVDQRSKLELSLGDFVPDMASQRHARKGCVEFFVRKCKICNTTDAACKCVECDSIMCTGCFEKFHQASAAIRQHEPVPLLSTKNESQSAEAKCREHGKPIEYFCTEDNAAICSRCYIMGGHQNHPIISYEEKNKELINDIETEAETAYNVLRHLERSDNRLASFVPDVKQEIKKVVETISESFLGLHTLLQVREMEVTESLTQIMKDVSASLEEKRESFSIDRLKLEAALKDARMLIENNALVIDSVDLLERLRAAKATPCLVVKKSETESETSLWNETYKEELVATMKQFGDLSGNILDNIEFLPLDKAPPGFEDLDNDDRASVASSSVSAAGREKVYRQASTKASTISSEDVVIENSDADSDISSRPSSRKLKSEPPAVSSTKQPFQESLALPVIKGRPQKVSVTHIVSPNDFLVQLSGNKRKLETLAHNINTWCRREFSSKHIPANVDVGTFVLARYSVDKTWYRAKVLGLVEDKPGSQGPPKVHVQFIDYGNEEVLPVKELRHMEKRFMIYPVFTVRCSLSDVAPYDEQQLWSPDTVQEFQKMTEDQVFLLSTFSEIEQLYEVDLLCIPNEDVLDDGYVSVRDILVFLELARFRVHSDKANLPTPSSYKKVEFIKPTVVKSGSTVDVIVTSADSPSDIHMTCQGDERAYYLNMLDEMQEMYSKDAHNVYSLYYPRLNAICSVQGKDGFWYRAKVVSPPKNRQVTVSLVDIGSRLVVSYDHIKKLHSKFIKLPAQALPCCLADVASAEKGGEWSAEAKHWCRKIMTGATGIARIKRWGQPAEIVLWLGSKVSALANQSINFLLVEEGLAVSTGLSSVGAAQGSLYEPGGYSASGTRSQRGRSVVGKQDSRDSVSLPEPATRGRSGSSSSTASSTAGSIKANVRGQVSPSPSKNTQPSGTSRPSQEKPKRSPKAAKEAKPRKQGASSSRSEELGEQAARMEKEKVQQEIQRALSSDGSGVDGNGGSIFIEVIVSSYESPGDFVLRVRDKEEQLATLMTDLQAEYEDSQPDGDHMWKAEEFCAARYSADGQWYRGKVLTCDPEKGCLVEMVDYGYMETVDMCNMRPLARPLGAFMECAAVRCHIANLVPAGSGDMKKWSRTASEFMRTETKDRKLYIKQEGDVNDQGLPIDIIVETEIPETAFDPAIRTYHSLRQAILDRGLAMPTKKQSQPPTPDSEAFEPFQRVIFEKNCGAYPETEDVNTTTEVPVLPPTEPQLAPPAAETSISSYRELMDPSLADTVVEERKTKPKKVPADTLILPSYPELTLGEPMEVLPTYVDFDGTIYAQPKEWEDMVMHLDHELQRVYGTVSEAPSMQWQAGQVCVAYYPADDRWYRAVILDVLDGDVKVRYFDYGNSETVKSSYLREMLLEFANVHPLALFCKLHDVIPSSLDGKWPVPVMDYLHELLVNAWCGMTIVSVEDSGELQVELIKTSGLGAAQHLVEQSMASRVSDLTLEYERSSLISQVLAAHNPFPTLDFGLPGEMFRAILTHVELPNLIYVQRVAVPEPEEFDFVKSGEIAKINGMVEEFQEMMEKLNAINSMPLSQLPDQGFMCAAQYGFDGRWYRGLCIESYKTKSTSLILYVDFGTTEEVPRDRLRLLHSEFWVLPAQAIRVYFNIVPPSGPHGLWGRDSINGVVHALANKEIVVRVAQTDPLTVELLVEGEGGEMRLAYESLIEAGLALLPENVEAWKILSQENDDDGDEDVLVEGREQGRSVEAEGADDDLAGKNLGGEGQHELDGLGESEKVDWWAAGDREGVETNQAEDSAPKEDEENPEQTREAEESSSGSSNDEWTTDDEEDDVDDGDGDMSQAKEETAAS